MSVGIGATNPLYIFKWQPGAGPLLEPGDSLVSDYREEIGNQKPRPATQHIKVDPPQVAKATVDGKNLACYFARSINKERRAALPSQPDL